MGQAIILVTHDPVVAAATRRISYFKDGMVEREGGPGKGEGAQGASRL